MSPLKKFCTMLGLFVNSALRLNIVYNQIVLSLIVMCCVRIVFWTLNKYMQNVIYRLVQHLITECVICTVLESSRNYRQPHTCKSKSMLCKQTLNVSLSICTILEYLDNCGQIRANQYNLYNHIILDFCVSIQLKSPSF